MGEVGSRSRTTCQGDLFKYGAATGAAATVGAAMPAAHAHGHGLPWVSPAPKPIPGGSRSPTGRWSTPSSIRAMEGTYVAEDGSRRRALFAGL